MTSEKTMTAETVSAQRIPQRVPNFDPTQLAREAVNKAGEKVRVLDLKHKKTWFRLACPNGGVVLNPLRVTDQMAIFEARVFAGADDRNPLASFTATRSADKTTGGQYIRLAQEDALNEALKNAGFSLQHYEMIRARQTEAVQTAPAEAQEKEAPPVAEFRQEVKPEPAAGKDTPPAPQSEQKSEPVTEQTPPADTRPQPIQKDRPAPVAPQPRYAARSAPEQKESAPTVVDISAGKPKDHKAQETAAQAESAQATLEDSVASGADAAAPAYSADMTVEEICQVMTLEQAKAIKVQEGTCRGWTLEQVAKDRPSSLKWLLYASTFADNVLKAAAKLVLDDLELKMAG